MQLIEVEHKKKYKLSHHLESNIRNKYLCKKMK